MAATEDSKSSGLTARAGSTPAPRTIRRSMQFYIPELGDVITLAQDWTFTVINEKRNAGLAVLMGREKSGDWYFPFGTKENPVIDEYNGRWGGRNRIPVDPGTHTFPAGTSLEVDRIYIRKGNEDFSSVTFKTRVGGKQVRFFARINDVNRIIF